MKVFIGAQKKKQKLEDNAKKYLQQIRVRQCQTHTKYAQERDAKQYCCTDNESKTQRMSYDKQSGL